MSKRLRRSAPVRMLVDTCVWLDLAKDPTGRSLIGAFEELVRADEITPVVTRTILNEFAENKARLIEESGHSVSSMRRHAREAVEEPQEIEKDENSSEGPNEIDHRFVNLRDQVAEAVTLIENLFAAGELHETTNAIKARASQRGIERKAPFHRQRNGIIDAISIETYKDIIARNKRVRRFAFVTHNVKDFSFPGNPRLPHPDFADLFTTNRSRYFITLGEALRSIRPEQFVDLAIEQEWKEQPRRRIAEIVTAEHQLFEKVWYNRHMRFREKVERGNIRIVERQALPGEDSSRVIIQRNIWDAALRTADAVKERYGSENLGPWKDFEWGMINGKLSALRWVLGDEWDMLT
jgi:hypothetical protein